MSRQLPPNPHIDVLKKQAKALLSAYQAGQADVLEQVSAVIDDLPSSAAQSFTLRHAQQVLARDYGFSSWQALSDHIAVPGDWAVGRFAFYRNLASDLADSYRAGNLSTYGVLGEEMNRRMQGSDDPVAAAQGCITWLADCRDWAELGQLAPRTIDDRGIDNSMLTAIESLHEGFTERIAERTGGSAEVAFVDYTTVCEYLISLGRPSHSFRCSAEGVDGPFVIDMGPRVAEVLSGRAAEVVQPLLNDLLALWPPALAIQNASRQEYTDPFGIRAGRLYDTCILVAYEVQFGTEPGGLLSICYPEPSIAGLLAQLREG